MNEIMNWIVIVFSSIGILWVCNKIWDYLEHDKPPSPPITLDHEHAKLQNEINETPLPRNATHQRS